MHVGRRLLASHCLRRLAGVRPRRFRDRSSAAAPEEADLRRKERPMNRLAIASYAFLAMTFACLPEFRSSGWPLQLLVGASGAFAFFFVLVQSLRESAPRRDPDEEDDAPDLDDDDEISNVRHIATCPSCQTT